MFSMVSADTFAFVAAWFVNTGSSVLTRTALAFVYILFTMLSLVSLRTATLISAKSVHARGTVLAWRADQTLVNIFITVSSCVPRRT